MSCFKTNGTRCGFGLLFGLVLTHVASAVEPPITAVAFSSDGKSVVAASQSGVHVFSWPDLRRQRTIKATASNLHCLAFSPNGKYLAVGGGNPAEVGIVEVWSWPAGTSAAIWKEHTDSIRAIVWRDSSQLVSASMDHEIKLWNLTKKASLRTIKGHSRGVSSLCVLNKGQMLVSAADDQTVRVWDLATGKLVRSLSQHTRPIHALAPRPGQRALPMIASAAADRTIRFWQPTIGRMVRYVRLKSAPLSIAWSKDGAYMIAACDDGRIRVIDPATVAVANSIPAVRGWAYSLAVHSTDGSIVVGGQDGQLIRVVPKPERR